MFYTSTRPSCVHQIRPIKNQIPIIFLLAALLVWLLLLPCAASIPFPIYPGTNQEKYRNWIYRSVDNMILNTTANPDQSFEKNPIVTTHQYMQRKKILCLWQTKQIIYPSASAAVIPANVHIPVCLFLHSLPWLTLYFFGALSFTVSAASCNFLPNVSSAATFNKSFSRFNTKSTCA